MKGDCVYVGCLVLHALHSRLRVNDSSNDKRNGTEEHRTLGHCLLRPWASEEVS